MNKKLKKGLAVLVLSFLVFVWSLIGFVLCLWLLIYTTLLYFPTTSSMVFAFGFSALFMTVWNVLLVVLFLSALKGYTKERVSIAIKRHIENKGGK